MRFFVLIAICFSCTSFATAQIERGDNGEIEDQSVEISKDLTIKLPIILKSLEINRQTLVPDAPAPQQYQYKDYNLNLPDVDSKVKVASMPADTIKVVKKSFVQGGVGTYLTSYLEAWHENEINKTFSFGAHARHLASANGPVSVIASGNSRNDIDFFGKAVLEKIVIKSEFEYNRRRYNFYGYRPNNEGSKIASDSVKQVFNTIGLKLELFNRNPADKFQYNAKVQYFNWSDAFKAQENEVVINGYGSYQISKPISASLAWDNSFSTRKDTKGSQGRNLVWLKPSLNYQENGLNLSLGVNLAADNDTSSPRKTFHVYPVLKANYEIIKNKLIIYAALDGDMRKQNLRTLTLNNPWLEPNVALYHTNDAFRFVGGLCGNIVDLWSYQIQGGITQFKNRVVFVNSRSEMAKFQLWYLDGTLLQFRINSEYKNTKGLSLGAGLELNDYSIQKSLVAYALPTFIASAHAAHVYKNKCTSQIDVHYYNSTKALKSVTGTTAPTYENAEVAGFFNLDLKFAYQITKPLGAFLQVQNLLNQKNPVFYNYSSRGILFMIGASYRF